MPKVNVYAFETCILVIPSGRDRSGLWMMIEPVEKLPFDADPIDIAAKVLEVLPKASDVYPPPKGQKSGSQAALRKSGAKKWSKFDPYWSVNIRVDEDESVKLYSLAPEGSGHTAVGHARKLKVMPLVDEFAKALKRAIKKSQDAYRPKGYRF